MAKICTQATLYCTPIIYIALYCTTLHTDIHCPTQLTPAGNLWLDIDKIATPNTAFLNVKIHSLVVNSIGFHIFKKLNFTISFRNTGQFIWKVNFVSYEHFNTVNIITNPV